MLLCNKHITKYIPFGFTLINYLFYTSNLTETFPSHFKNYSNSTKLEEKVKTTLIIEFH